LLDLALDLPGLARLRLARDVVDGALRPASRVVHAIADLLGRVVDLLAESGQIGLRLTFSLLLLIAGNPAGNSSTLSLMTKTSTVRRIVLAGDVEAWSAAGRYGRRPRGTAFVSGT
jgi:hypothetical protein